jgi:diphthamide biosynthesis protein 7
MASPLLKRLESLVFNEIRNRCHTSAPSPLLAVADAEGSITLYQWREVNLWTHPWLTLLLMNLLWVAISLSTKLNTMCAIRHFMSLSGLVESQDRSVSPFYFIFQISSFKCYGSDLGSIVVSLSNGDLCLLSPSEGSNMAVAATWHAHDYEPWIATWNYWDPNVIYSGH